MAEKAGHDTFNSARAVLANNSRFTPHPLIYPTRFACHSARELS